MANDYNRIAKFYDMLSHIVFQRSIIKAQVYLISFINDNDKVLIVGGGTGWILEDISKLGKKHVSVWYVEKSSAMIELAKNRNTHLNTTFVQQAIEDYSVTENFDVVITPFLFDNFLRDKIDLVFSKLNAAVKENGTWLYADFVNNKTNKWWQQFLLRTMYLFFRVTTNIEAQELIDMHPYFETKYSLLSQQFFYNGFIQAVAFKKTG